MDDEKVVETALVDEDTAPVETVEEETTPVEETAPVETESNEDVLTLLREVLTEIKALSALMTTEPTIEVVDDGSNDSNADELEKQLEDLDF